MYIIHMCVYSIQCIKYRTLHTIQCNMCIYIRMYNDDICSWMGLSPSCNSCWTSSGVPGLIVNPLSRYGMGFPVRGWWQSPINIINQLGEQTGAPPVKIQLVSAEEFFPWCSFWRINPWRTKRAFDSLSNTSGIQICRPINPPYKPEWRTLS